MPQPPDIQKPRNPLRTILSAGLLAGTLDITAAFINAFVSYGSNPVRVLQYIASGVFGRESAFSGGALMAFWGCTFHFTIAFAWTVLLFIMYPKIPLLSKNKIITGMLYGLCIWLVMNLIVLPLTNVPKPTFPTTQVIVGIVILMVMVGFPISLIVSKYYARK